MGLRFALHVAGTCLGACLIPQIASAALLGALDGSAPSLSVHLDSIAEATQQPPSLRWLTQAGQPEDATWSPERSGTSGGVMPIRSAEWAALRSGTAGGALNGPLQISLNSDPPVPLPGAVWLLGSGALALRLTVRRFQTASGK